MVAIAIEESTLNPQATGYNCRYKVATKADNNRQLDKLTGYWIDLDTVSPSKTSIKGYISTFCRKGQENLAWSKDGGLFMIHNPLAEDYNVEVNIKKAQDKLAKQGLNAWVAHSSGRYKDNLQEAKKLLTQI